MSMVTIATAPSVPSPRALPPRIEATAARPAPRPARSTLVSGSVTARNIAATATATTARRRTPAPPRRIAPAHAATSTATLNPLMARTWLIPAARNSAAGRESPGNLMPVVMALTNARLSGVDHSGIERASAPLAAVRAPANALAATPAGSSTTRFDDVTDSDPGLSRGRMPGLRSGSVGRNHPRTRTTDPRGGSGANPDTRTRISPATLLLLPRTSIPEMSSVNVCTASRIAYFDRRSLPPSSMRGAVETIPRSVTGASTASSSGWPRDDESIANTAPTAVIDARIAASRVHRRRTVMATTAMHAAVAARAVIAIVSPPAAPSSTTRGPSSMRTAHSRTIHATAAPMAIATAARNASGHRSRGMGTWTMISMHPT